MKVEIKEKKVMKEKKKSFNESLKDLNDQELSDLYVNKCDEFRRVDNKRDLMVSFMKAAPFGAFLSGFFALATVKVDKVIFALSSIMTCVFAGLTGVTFYGSKFLKKVMEKNEQYVESVQKEINDRFDLQQDEESEELDEESEDVLQ